MNTLKFYPKILREIYQKNIINAGIKKTPECFHNRAMFACLILSIISSLVFFFLNYNLAFSLLVFVLSNIFVFFYVSLKASARIKQMEKFFPDVISLMASNLRAGITIDRSFLLSARPEFAPLDDEILKTGKDVATGKDFKTALEEMGRRIDSQKISKIINLIVSGLNAGGNISDLLEQTSSNMKEKEFIEKRATSSILMYVIFIFFAVGVGAPILFSLSTVLVKIVIDISSQLPEAGSYTTNLAISFSEVSITPQFIIYYSLIFMIVTDLISSLVIGLVNKGEGKAGLKYFIPLVIFSIGVFFLFRTIVSSFIGGAFKF